MRISKIITLLGFLLLCNVAYAVDTDLDALPDDFEMSVGKDPVTADYVIAASSSIVMVHVSGGRCGMTVAKGLACYIADNGVVCDYHDLWPDATDVPTELATGQVKATGLKLGDTWACACHQGGSTCWGENPPASAGSCPAVSQHSTGSYQQVYYENPLCGIFIPAYNKTLDCQVINERTISCSQTSTDSALAASGDITLSADIGHISVGSFKGNLGIYAMTARGLHTFTVQANGTVLTFLEMTNVFSAAPPVIDPDGDGKYSDVDKFPFDKNNDGADNHFEVKNDHLGSAIAIADMNIDSYDDVIVGAPLADVTINQTVVKAAGLIKVISGNNGARLNFPNLHGTVAKQQFGLAIAVVADMSTVPDGIPDLVIGNPLADIVDAVTLNTMKDAGNVSVYDSVTGAIITSIADGAHAGDKFGAAVAVGDVNNDAVDDLVVGAPLTDVLLPVIMKDAGQVTVFNGISNSVLYTRDGTQAKELFGSAVAVNTVDHRLLIGSPGFDVLLPSKLMDVGQVQIFDGTDGGAGAALLPVPGSIKGDKFGSALTSFNQDLDGDTFVDWAVGIPGADSVDAITGKALKDIGKLQIFSGLNALFSTEYEGSLAGDHFGAALNANGDTDNDGENDIAVGSPGHDPSILQKNAGMVEVIGGAGL